MDSCSQNRATCTADIADSRDSVPVFELDPLRDRRWADFVATHPDASVFHSVNWLNALHSAYGYEPKVVSTSRPEEPLTTGVVFCRVDSWLTGKRIVSLPFADHCEPLVRFPEELSALVRYLNDDVQRNHRNYLELRPISQRPARQCGLTECSAYFWHSLDLSGTCDALFKSFDKDGVQRRIRRAQRESMQYQVGNSQELLEQFFKLMVMTRRRHLLPPPPYAWFDALSRSFRELLQVRLVRYQDRPIAASLTLKHGRTVTYKYGCSDTRFKRLGATPFLFWKIIEEAKTEGLTLLDLGRSDVGNTGLIRFKENWRARRVPLHYLKSGSDRGFEQGSLTAVLRRVFVPFVPQWSLIAAGKLLYPHIG